MGLDVYVMPLSRFWSGEWESVQTVFGRKLGVPGSTIYADGTVVKHPEEAPLFPASYSEWARSNPEELGPNGRERIATGDVPPVHEVFLPLSGLLENIGRPSVWWDDDDWTRCHQEQFGWEELTALLNYSQAEGAGGGAPVPPERIRDWTCPEMGEGCGRGVAFPHLAIVASHLGHWLPGDFDDLGGVPMTDVQTGQEDVVLFGSLRRLREELDRLNRDWGMDRDWADLRAGEKVCADDDPHVRAKVGWAILRGMCRRALEMDLPMMLSG